MLQEVNHRDLDEGSSWQKGTEFLKSSEAEWPISNTYEYKTEDLPERPKRVMEVKEILEKTMFPEIMSIERFRSLPLLLNTTARLIRLQLRFKEKAEGEDRDIKPSDVEEAERQWIIEAQRALNSEVKLGKHRRLCPQSQNGILVVDGRAERWMGATWNQQKFVLLPKNHGMSRLIAIQKHRENGHLAVSATVAQIRNKYWIIGVRRIVSSIVDKCTDCKAKREK